MYMLHEPVEKYWEKFQAFDEMARSLRLTPADRRIAWAEYTTDEHWNEWPVPVGHFLSDPYYVGTNILVRDTIADFITDFCDPAAAYELFVFIGGIGAGKALALDEVVPTPGESTTMGELRPGDMVLDENGEPTEVLETREWADRPCRRLLFGNGASVVADIYHEWPTREGYTKETFELRPGMHIGTPERHARLVGVEVAPPQPTKCITVASPSHLFLTSEGHIPTHNSFSASLLLMYTLYQLSCLKRPQKYLNGFPGVSLSGDAEIALMNSSGAGAAQAGKIVYGEIFEKIQRSPYFKAHYPPYPNKGLDCNTLLPTPSGFVRMGDVEAGDTLIGGDGRPTTVVEAYNPREIACYEITFVDGTKVVADAEHRWRVRDRLGSRKWQVLETSELRAGRHSVPAPPLVELPEHPLPIDPYALGVWLGDGTSTGAELTCAEDEILDHLAAVGEPARRLPHGPYTCTWAGPRAGSRTGKFVTRLRALGLLDNKHIPMDYLRASVDQRLSLLQGLMDTDGHATKRDGGCIFVSTKEALARDCHSLVRSLGIRATLREGRAKLDGVDKGPCWRVSFVTDLPVFRLERKQAVLRDRIRKPRPSVGIKKIERVATRPTRCLRVDSPEHTYLFGREMLVTHNSSELEFPGRVRLAPGTSSMRSALGWNMFAFAVDEAAFGIENERTDSIRELFSALNQRRRSRFGRCGWGGLFTSPGSEQGFVEIIAGEGDEWDATILVRRTTTWEAKDELVPGARVFLLDRHADSVRILETDLIYVGPDPDTGLPICQRANGEVVRIRNVDEDELQEHLTTKAVNLNLQPDVAR